MGFGDEKGKHLEDLKPAALEISSRAFPDMKVVPGGSHTEWALQRDLAAQAGPAILNQLAKDGFVDLEAVKRKYEGEQ